MSESTPVVDKRITSPEEAAAASAAAFEHRHHYRIELAIAGRIRFLSHLEMVDTLLGALRRSGAQLALSPGMRPKPRIKVAMPRPVATEAWSDIVEVELVDRLDSDAFALRLSESLPDGLTLIRLERLEGAYSSAASRVAGAIWRWHIDPDMSVADLSRWVDELRSSDEILIERVSPGKPTRLIDVRRVVGDITVHEGVHDGPFVRAFIQLTPSGSAKPEEVVRAISHIAGTPIKVVRTVRESIAIAQPGQGGVIAQPELVGADVPDGPEKPWGAC